MLYENMKKTTFVDMNATTHRKAEDCTCYECTREETITFLKEKQEKDVQLQQRKEGSQDNPGGLS